MQLLGAFFRMIRWSNLVFIALTQCLFHFCVVMPSAIGTRFSFPLQLNTHLFILLCLSSVLIAAAGYVINDYFDINIDQVNKPERMVVEKVISRRWALVWHLILSGLGIAIGVYLSLMMHNWFLAIANTACVVLLWYYSTSYKRRLLVGNVLISALTAWVILVLLVAELPGWWSGSINDPLERITAARLARIGILYSGFAFIISLVREVVKDIEDMDGDHRNGCRTMPIVWGITPTKIFAAVWLVVLIAAVFISQLYVIQFGWWFSIIYIGFLVLAPLLMVFRKLLKANAVEHYSQLSREIKVVMLSGILSMLFFLHYSQ
jgi:4-hydroxybenzoate polyprenyltransferase